VVFALAPAAGHEAVDAEVNAKIRKEGKERSQILRTMHYLTDVYGPRLTGSPNHKAAAEWAIKQMELAGEAPDIVIGCAGGGSNFSGIAFPFLRERLAGNASTRFLAVEPASCPSLTRGEYRYDFGDTVGMTPLLKMHTLGHEFRPAPIHAGGLRYHGMAPLVSHLYELGFIEARAYAQNTCFEAAVQFARTEGIIPAPESSHAIRAAIDEALEAREAGEERVILFNLSGHGYFDMAAYDQYLAGELTDVEYEPAQEEPVAV